MKKQVIIDADIATCEKIESLAIRQERILEIDELIFTHRLFFNHSDAYDYFVRHVEEIELYFVKIERQEELVHLNRLQSLSDDTVFMVYSDNPTLNDDLDYFARSKNWVHGIVSDNQVLESLIDRILQFTFTSKPKLMEINGNYIVMTSILYAETYKRNRNYVRVVLRNNECIILTTLSSLEKNSSDLIRLSRGLLVNKNNIRGIEKDGLTLQFEGTLQKVTVPKVCKKRVKEFVREINPEVFA